jgi:hypothetical protein
VNLFLLYVRTHKVTSRIFSSCLYKTFFIYFFFNNPSKCFFFNYPSKCLWNPYCVFILFYNVSCTNLLHPVNNLWQILLPILQMRRARNNMFLKVEPMLGLLVPGPVLMSTLQTLPGFKSSCSPFSG